MAQVTKGTMSRREFLAQAGGFVAGAAMFEIGGPLNAPSQQLAPKWPCPCTCPFCGEIFNMWESLTEHIAAQHLRKLPEIKKVSKPTYSDYLTDLVGRFDQKNEVFCRSVWDEGYQARLQAVAPRPRGDTPEQILEGNALRAGAIYVDDAAGSLHPQYGGYSGHQMGIGGLFSWEDEVNKEQYRVTDPSKMSARIKQVAKLYGASLVGICEVDQRWVYSHYFDRATGNYGELDLPYRYAVVMGIEMDWPSIDTSPGFEASAATAIAYSQMAELAPSLAKYIRALGYQAVPCGNDTAQSIPLAIDAGLGQLGRCGLLVSPQFGPRQRLCKVLTDLPLQPDQPIDFGLHEFCPKCGICAKFCPAEAIMKGERTTEQTSISNRPGILRWPVNVENCYLFWRANGIDCSNCVAACPWGWPIRRWL